MNESDSQKFLHITGSRTNLEGQVYMSPEYTGFAKHGLSDLRFMKLDEKDDLKLWVPGNTLPFGGEFPPSRSNFSGQYTFMGTPSIFKHSAFLEKSVDGNNVPYRRGVVIYSLPDSGLKISVIAVEQSMSVSPLNEFMGKNGYNYLLIEQGNHLKILAAITEDKPF